ncbi:hypothetical protein LPJ61_004681 [Coemansia biformis]|uniref:Sphingomyelin synthase-like domain-containing protein n=1 Tax=Coemansia biformis TaxID=1286918 RepID=A0A9W7Y913_9FUNG|nr:hypothetical protein LPJ61_004681 [Coemansia biformis]
MAVAGGLKQRLHQRLPPVVRELLFTLFAILSLLSVVSLMVLCQVWSDMRWVKWNKYAHSRWDSPNGGAVHGLRDLFLEVVPKMITGELSACTDKIFSGHTSILVFIFLMWVRYSRHWAFIVYSGIHTVVGISSVLLTRLHYSVDVLLAIVMVFFVHHTYYWSLEIAVRERAAAAASSAPALVASAPGGYRPVPPGEGAGSTLYPCADVIQIPDILVGEDAEKAIGVPRDCITHAASTVYRVDAAELLINRKPSMVLPTMVAWMDGLWMR